MTVQMPANTHRDAHSDDSWSSGGGARAAKPTRAGVSVSALLMRAEQKNTKIEKNEREHQVLSAVRCYCHGGSTDLWPRSPTAPVGFNSLGYRGSPNHHQCRTRKLPVNSPCLVVGNVNCRSILRKQADITALLEENDVDILCITESWLNDTMPDACLVFPGYKIYRSDRCSCNVP